MFRADGRRKGKGWEEGEEGKGGDDVPSSADCVDAASTTDSVV